MNDLQYFLGRFEYWKDVDRDRTNFMGFVEYVCVLPPSPWRIFKLNRLRDFAAKSSCKNHARNNKIQMFLVDIIWEFVLSLKFEYFSWFY